MQKLKNKKVAILATDGFEYAEFKEPYKALTAEGAEAVIISPKEDEIRGWENGNWSMYPVHVDKTINEAVADDYDGLVLPGGVMNPDALRTNEKVLEFVRSFFTQGKPVAAICHGPWVLINAEVVKDRKMTSYPSIKKDLENAGAHWKDEPVVVDQGLVTSRSPKDLDAFCDKLVEEIREGFHSEQMASTL